MIVHTLLITDIDETLYSWVDYFCPCFRAMVHALAKETKFSEEAIIEDFKRVYSIHQSLEYAYSVQELSLLKDFSSDERERLVTLAHTVYGTVKRKSLKPYNGVKETLLWAKETGMMTVAVTNSPIDNAIGRLFSLGLLTFFTGIAAWEGHPLPDDQPIGKQLRDAFRRKEDKKHDKRLKVWPLALDELKPSPLAYLRIIDDLKVPGSAVCVVGDSLYKDISPASSMGLTTILVDYKNTFPVNPKNLETLLRITHWDEDKISKVYKEATVEPTYCINRFDRLKDILNPPQLNLFFDSNQLSRV